MEGREASDPTGTEEVAQPWTRGVRGTGGLGALRIESLEATLARGTHNALLRYTLGCACPEAERDEEGLGHLERAVAHDPGYSAAWMAFGRTLSEVARADEAIEVY